jgi:hypothetical protein
MGDAWIKGATVQKANGKRPHYDNQWLECMVRDLYRAVLDDPVPRELLDVVERISDPATGDVLQRVRRWRAKTEELRTAAESMSNKAARNSLLRLARDYEALAEHAEKEAHLRGEKKRGAG